MIVPDHWAEARRQHRKAGRQITVRRWGWSTASAAEALTKAEARADEALRRLLAGEKLPRTEPRVPYNGAEGVPIREEVLARHGEQVITRNAYGARCLNSPNALFADSDPVRRFFTAAGADPVYVRMCNHQRCFRARLTGKPWRMGITHHLRPRPGTWPVHPERIGLHTAWVEAYESRAREYAACRYLESVGSGRIHPVLQPVVHLHDRESRALLADARLA